MLKRCLILALILLSSLAITALAKYILIQKYGSEIFSPTSGNAGWFPLIPHIVLVSSAAIIILITEKLMITKNINQ